MRNISHNWDMSDGSRLILWFSEVGKEDIPRVGGKGANLGEMTKAGFPVPGGFIVTATAYFHFLRENKLNVKIKNLLQTVNYDRSESMQQVSALIKKLIMNSHPSDELVEEIFAHYRTLSGNISDALVAVRSSATAEDLPTASFAGQQETFLNVKGEANLLLKVKQAWASLFEPRAIFYRHEKKFDHFRVGIAIVVQKMINSEKSGVMFTIDPVSNDKTKIIIEAIYGLGEYIVQGIVTPDHYELDKKSLTINLKKIEKQEIQLVKASTGNAKKNVLIMQRNRQKLSDYYIVELAKLGKAVEKHYYFPQDLEWAFEKNTLYLVQTRPITTITAQTKMQEVDKSLAVILSGAPASPGIASGPVKIIRSVKQIDSVLSGDVLVTEQTNPDFVPAMKKAVAIITEKGGRTSHAAIVSRELGIPAIVGTETATKILKNGMVVTVNGQKGEVYKGATLQSETSPVGKVYRPKIQTATKVYVNLAQPDLAAKIAREHVDGVGLLRAEFMIADIGVHPKKMIRDGKRQAYIEKLAEQLEMFCSAFNPRPVVYRTTDFKTSEYRGLVGGKDFEPNESNPMLGYRGAFRYIHDPEVFALELEAFKIVRNKKNLKNLWMMIPFVRTVKELIEVKKLISAAGLYRSPTFKLWMMVEIPSNVILLDKFIEVGIDGVSIGSNDLTMLILGTDRDNSEVAHAFDEQDDAVAWALEHVIKTCQRYKITSSICGQAPSLYPALLEKLVNFGITSVSIAPDVIDSVRKDISAIERKQGRK